MAGGMEIIHDELGICEKGGFSGHAVRAQSTGIIVYHPLGGLGPPGNHHRENIVSPFTKWYAVEAIADAVGAPCCHDTACQPLLFVLGVILRAFFSPCAAFMHLIVFQ